MVDIGHQGIDVRQRTGGHIALTVQPTGGQWRQPRNDRQSTD